MVNVMFLFEQTVGWEVSREDVMGVEFVTCPKCNRSKEIAITDGEEKKVSCDNCGKKFVVVLESANSKAA